MRRRNLILAVLAIGVLVTGCAALFGGEANPVTSILSPANGSAFDAGAQIPITISASEETGAGIARVEIFINGALFKTEMSPTGSDANFVPTLSYVADAPGGVNIMAIAYTPDGAASAPATVVANVGGSGAAQPAESGPTSEPPPEPEAGWVTGEVIVDSGALREKPGIYCELVCSVMRGEVINLMEYSKDNNWFMTDYDCDPTVEDEITWIWIENVRILGNEEDIIHGDEVGCLGCGDGICSPEIGEDCGTCPDDCGPCCGNGICEPARGEDCSTCEPDCGSCCGNGVCEPGYGENCFTCEPDCGPCCGNGICEADYGEDCETCEIDCGACCVCGDGYCDPLCGETYSTCSADCIG